MGMLGCSKRLASRMPIRCMTARGLRCQTFVPVLEGQAPADLHAGRKGQLGDRYMQAEEADELGGCLQLHGPEAPSSLLDQRLAAIGQRIALVALERSREILHDPRVCVQFGKGRPVARAPLPHEQAFGFEFDRVRHCSVL